MAAHGSPDERRARGRALRNAVARESQGGWKAPRGRVDPIRIQVQEAPIKLPVMEQARW
jgi:hypothetical protein